MKILFEADELMDSNANINIAKILAKELQKYYEVIWVCQNTEIRKETGYKWGELKNVDGLKCYAINGIPLGEVQDFSKKNSWEKKNKFAKILKLLLHPVLAFKLFNIGKWGQYRYYTRKNAYLMDRIIRKEKIDLVLTLAAPYYSAITLSQIKCKVKKVLYQLDPYTFNTEIPGTEKKKKKLEKKLLSKIDRVIVTKLMYQKYFDVLYKPYAEKVNWVEFPNVRKLNSKDETKSIFQKKFINCVFLGNFYVNIRNPRFLLELFKQLDDRKIILHIIGKGAEEIVLQYKEYMSKQLVIHGSVALSEVDIILQEADILVNLNNSISNQLASKIFDYISSGKPILNICKLADCPSLEYLENYPLCCTIFEELEVKKDVMEKVREFCYTQKGNQVGFEKIEALYCQSTPEFVGNEIKRIMENL